MGLQRKQIRVRTKSGKVYRRSVLVRSSAQKSKNGRGKLHALNPGENGGSDMSWFALAVGNRRAQTVAPRGPQSASTNHGTDNIGHHFTESGQHALARQAHGRAAVQSTTSSAMGHLQWAAATGLRGQEQKSAFGAALHDSYRQQSSFMLRPRELSTNARGVNSITDHEAYRRTWRQLSGGADVAHVPQNSNKWVR